MNESEQNDQRREAVFQVLDQLREQGERINADKVARLAKMGKQTVLPYYKEWRFLDDVDRQQQDELPPELVRTMKRGIAKWKHTLAEEAQSFQEQANEEIDQLKQTLQSLLDDQHAKEKQLEALANELDQVKEESGQLRTQSHEKDQAIAGLKAQLGAAEQNNQSLENQVIQQKKEYETATQTLEVKLDQRHQEQLNHWIKVVDDERRKQQTLEKQLAQHQEVLLKTEKEKNELSHRLDNKNRAFIEACEERNQLKAQCKALQNNHKPLEQSALLLDCDTNELPSQIRELQGKAQQVDHQARLLDESHQQADNLNHRLQVAENQLKTVSELEKQLEKSRGYIEALEKNTQPSEKKDKRS